MSSLKLDLKILDKVFILFLFIFSSCQTIKVESLSGEMEIISPQVYNEYEIPYINDIELLDITASKDVIIPTVELSNKYLSMPILSYEPIKNPWYSTESLEVSVLEYSLPPLVLSIKKADVVIPLVTKTVTKPTVTKPTVIKPTVIKPTVTKATVIKPTVTKPTVTKPTVTKPTVTKPVVIKPVVIKPVVTLLDDIEVFTGKSFTVEMDQTGWLYEKEQDDLIFKNKFYTNNKVLFEFIAEKTGLFNIEFSKYTDNGLVLSKINVTVENRTSSTEKGIKAEPMIVIPESIQESQSEKKRLESSLNNIDTVENADEVYFKLGQIYYDEGLLKKSKEYFEYVYDNYPLSIYYEEAKEKMEYIINNFLKRR